MTVDEVYAEVAKDEVFYRASGGGVTIGGGEVTVWADFAAALLARCEDAGFGTAIETCGYANWRQLWKVARRADEVLYDVKHLDDTIHRQFTGVDTTIIQRNLKTLLRRHPAVVVRIPVIPGVNDDPGTIRDMACRMRALGVTRPIELLPYHRLGVAKYGRLGKEYALGRLESPEASAVEDLADAVRAEGLKCRIGG